MESFFRLLFKSTCGARKIKSRETAVGIICYDTKFELRGSNQLKIILSKRFLNDYQSDEGKIAQIQLSIPSFHENDISLVNYYVNNLFGKFHFILFIIMREDKGEKTESNQANNSGWIANLQVSTSERCLLLNNATGEMKSSNNRNGKENSFLGE